MVVLRTPSFGWPWVGLALVLLCQLAADRWTLSTNAVNVDYFTLWSVPRALPTIGPRDIYAPDTQRDMATLVRTMTTSSRSSMAQRRSMAASDQLYAGRIDATATPFAYTLVGLTSSGDYERDLGRYRWASLLAFISAVLILGSLLQFPASVTITALVALSLCSAPLLAELRVANINQFQLLAVAGALWLIGRRWLAAAGLLLGAAVMFKPTIALVPVAFVALALADRRLRPAGAVTAGVVAGAAAAVAASSLYFGDWHVWPQFAESLARTLDAEYPLAHGNFGLAAVAKSQWRTDISLVVVAVVGASFLAVVALSRGARPVDDATRDDSEPGLAEWIAAAGIACGAMLLASRLVWLHYFLLLVPLVLLLMRPVDASESFKPRRYAGIAAGVVALLLLSPVVQSFAEDPLWVAMLANLAVIILVAAALDDLWRARRARVAARAVDAGPVPKRRRRPRGR